MTLARSTSEGPNSFPRLRFGLVSHAVDGPSLAARGIAIGPRVLYSLLVRSFSFRRIVREALRAGRIDAYDIAGKPTLHGQRMAGQSLDCPEL